MINQFRARRILSGVKNCLDAERRLLLAGNLASLPEQVSAREDLMNRFQALPPASDPDLAPLLEDIRTGAARNAKLLEAALAGLRDANETLGRIRKSQEKLGTYDEKGEVSPTTVARPRHERRA